MLQTVDAIGINIPAVFFFCVTVMGSIILYNYFTAIFVLSYMEILGRSDVSVSVSVSVFVSVSISVSQSVSQSV